MNPVKYSIRDLERITGIKAHTIRMWEKRYGIIMPERTSTNIRYYSDENLQKLLNISILNKNGYKISHISELSNSDIILAVEKLSDTTEGLDASINDLIMAAIDMKEEKIEELLNSSVLNLGFERSFCELVFPLFQKISVFWQIGRINSCQERFVTNLVRQKLLVAIDGLVGQANPYPRNFLVFTPAGEYNEIGLLFANYLIRKSGHEVVYLGPSVPLEHIERLMDEPKFKEILINISLPQVESDYLAYLKSLRQIFPDQKIHIIFTQDMPDFCQTNEANVHVYSTFEHFTQQF